VGDEKAVQCQMSDQVGTNPILGASDSPEGRGALVRLRDNRETVDIKSNALTMLQRKLLGPARHICAEGEEARVQLHTLLSVVELSLECSDSSGRGLMLEPEPLQGGVVGSSECCQYGADATTCVSPALPTDDGVDLVVALGQRTHGRIDRAQLLAEVSPSLVEIVQRQTTGWLRFVDAYQLAL
jgi:hypothetical protein